MDVPYDRAEFHFMIPTSTRDTLPWRLRTGRPGERRALTAADLVDLSAEFDLNADILSRLSTKLDIALSESLNLSQPELSSSRIKRGVRELKSAVQALGAAERKLANVGAILHDLRFKDPFSHVGRPNPSVDYLADFENASSSINEFRNFAEIAAREELVFYTGSPDKRRMRDERRRIVCTGIFNIWEESGRSISYTTDPVTSERKGPLIEFVNSVIERITDPPARLSGETIKVEIDEYTDHAERHRRATRG